MTVKLEAIASGYGLCYSNDEENLTQQFKVYAWCRLQVAQNQ